MMNTQTNPTFGAAMSVRAQTSQLVTNIAIQSGEPKATIYNRIFARLLFLYEIDVYTYPREPKESLLSVAERYGLIDKVYALAFAEQLYFQQYEE